ncbi:FecR family protein [uncultured Draconibacterium sp.]|uniref:FecR family protein n=1 Tax=uncultured Draconibacterium sp. TaxID=1573823 RepID=UPI003260DD07
MKKDNTEKINSLTEMVEVDYPQSKESIWNLMEEQLTRPATKETKVRKLNFQHLAIAASVAILLGIGSFMRFYQIDYTATAGEHLTAQLPDGSVVDLNGQSSLQVNPYWWTVKRTVKLKGEAYFEVEKGKRFSVVSNNGRTTVLGTSFNIYARNNHYEVSCLTGKVEVEVGSGIKQIIYPNQQAILNNNSIEVAETNVTHATDWRNNTFFFTSEPLQRVFNDIAIAYNINIDVQTEDIYTGSFKQSDNIEDVLSIVCVPLNLTFVKQQSGDYVIKKN